MSNELRYADWPDPDRRYIFAINDLLPTRGFDWLELDSDFDLFGDGSIHMLKTPRHTPGESLLYVRLPNRKILLVGDTVHLRMEARFFQDWRVGDQIETMGRTVGDSEISQFVALGGFFEELFMNQDFIEKSGPYPTRIAPAALIFAFAERLIIMTGRIHGVRLALISVEEMNSKRPLKVGDTMRVRVKVLDVRATRRSDRGIVTFLHTVLNQNDQEIMECRVKRMLRCRNA